MKIFKTFEEFVNELEDNKINEGAIYEYGCAMLYFDLPVMAEIHESIENDDIFEEEGKGLENETHITLLYGLHEDVSTENVLEAITNVTQDPISLGRISAFQNDKFDVLKFTAMGPSLYEMNKELSKLPHTTDYPDYNPHATIAYLKPGKAEAYIKKFEGKEFPVKPKQLVYSKPDGSKESFDIVDGKIKQ